VGTQARCEALTEILVEAEKLKMYRSDGTAYCEKCDNLVVRIQGVFTDVKIEDLSADEIEIIKAIKEKIISEEVFAQSSSILRNPKEWLGTLNE
jgi:hypothetical protein